MSFSRPEYTDRANLAFDGSGIGPIDSSKSGLPRRLPAREAVSWVAAVDYRRGSLRQKRGLPCQDYGKLEKIGDDLVIGVLSDGAADAPLAQLGTKAVVRSAMAYLTQRVEANPAAARRRPSRSAFSTACWSRCAPGWRGGTPDRSEAGRSCLHSCWPLSPGPRVSPHSKSATASWPAAPRRPGTTTCSGRPIPPTNAAPSSPAHGEAVRIDAIKAMSCPVAFVCAGTDGMGTASNQGGPVRPKTRSCETGRLHGHDAQRRRSARRHSPDPATRTGGLPMPRTT